MHRAEYHAKNVRKKHSKISEQRRLLISDSQAPRGRARFTSASEDGRRSGPRRKATRRVEPIYAHELVQDDASDAQHRRAAVLALDVQLERLRLRVVVAHPRAPLRRDVTGVAVRALLEHARLEHAAQADDLSPGRARDGEDRVDGTGRDVRELDRRAAEGAVAQVAREAQARL